MLQTSPPDSLNPYTRLRNISNALKSAQPAADGAAPHLVDHVSQVADKLRTSIAEDYTVKFESTLAKMKWPSQNLDLTGSSVQEWSHWCELLLDLQEP